VALAVTRVFHCNVNCSDLERSLAFYRDVLGLTQGAHTRPESPQDGAAFGLPQAQWDAWILTAGGGFADRQRRSRRSSSATNGGGDGGYDGAALDLLEWQQPEPIGTPYAPANHVGFTRLGLVTSDLDAAYDRLQRAGADCFGPPHEIGLEGAPPVRALVCTDPDGTMVELVAGTRDRLAFVAASCRDLERSVAFYRDVLGLRELARFAPGPQSGAGLRLDGEVEWEMAYLDDGAGFAVDLTQWRRPEAVPEPAYPSANHLGIFRMALLVDDIDAAHAELARLGVTCLSGPATLDMGPGIPPLRALLFPDPDGAMLELIEPPAAAASA